MFSALYCSLREYIRIGVDLAGSTIVGSQRLNCWCQCGFQQSVFSLGKDEMSDGVFSDEQEFLKDFSDEQEFLKQPTTTNLLWYH
jgi:hypothetical protein